MYCPVDLHAHSTASDGSLSPAELMRRAHGAGVRVMALTDHDTLDGLAEAAAAAAQLDLAFVPGVEVSVTWQGGTVHVVGLGVDAANARLQQGLAGLRGFRDWRAGEIARRLEKAGIGGSLEGACRLASGGLVSRTHFARYLVEAHGGRDLRRSGRRDRRLLPAYRRVPVLETPVVRILRGPDRSRRRVRRSQRPGDRTFLGRYSELLK